MRTSSTFSGRRLEQLRNGLRLTQHDLATRLRQRGFGTTQTTVSRWEAGQMPQASVLPALAEELGVEMQELFGDSSDEEGRSMETVLIPVQIDYDLLAQAIEARQHGRRAFNARPRVRV